MLHLIKGRAGSGKTAYMRELISKQIDNIAYNILKYPYKEVYADLYKEFVVPMIEQQIA